MPLLHSHPDLVSIRSSAAEVLACVLGNLFPQALLVGGEHTDIGFYYDFIFTQPFDAQVLELLETQMRLFIREPHEVRTLSMMRENAFDFLMHHNQPILAQRALEEASNIVSLFQLDTFFALSTSLHVAAISDIGAIKLLQALPALRLLPEQEEPQEVLRIYGTAFNNSMELKQFLKAYEKAKKFDHRLLGSELKLFEFQEASGMVDCYWLPKGELLRRQFEQIWLEECEKRVIATVSTPLVVRQSFFKVPPPSLNAFEVQWDAYVLSSSRLAQHIQLFLSQKNDLTLLPIRFGEIAQIYEEHKEALLCGLLRSYAWRSDLVTIFCEEAQVEQELIYSLQFIVQIVRIFDFEAHWRLVLPELKNIKAKHRSKEWLEKALSQLDISYEIESIAGEPRIEVLWTDGLGRQWVGPSIEVVESARSPRSPVVLATKAFGSLDRCIALLLEHSKGVLPFWLVPEQVRILPMGEKGGAYAKMIYEQCRQQGFRVAIDNRDEKLGMRIHAAEKERVPYLVLVGDKEAQQSRVSIRGGQKNNQELSLGDFLTLLHETCKKSKNHPINHKLGSEEGA
jgi:threonyl-tRNA synthetase